MMEIKQRIKSVISRTFKLDQVPDDVSQDNCENWDSLRHLNLVVDLEQEFDISIEPEEIAVMKSFQDIVKIVNDKLI